MGPSYCGKGVNMDPEEPVGGAPPTFRSSNGIWVGLVKKPTFDKVNLPDV